MKLIVIVFCRWLSSTTSICSKYCWRGLCPHVVNVLICSKVYDSFMYCTEIIDQRIDIPQSTPSKMMMMIKPLSFLLLLLNFSYSSTSSSTLEAEIFRSFQPKSNLSKVTNNIQLFRYQGNSQLYSLSVSGFRLYWFFLSSSDCWKLWLHSCHQDQLLLPILHQRQSQPRLWRPIR